MNEAPDIETIEGLLNGGAFDDMVAACPGCEGVSGDEQYTCTTCWAEGGNKTFSVSAIVEKLILEHKDAKQGVMKCKGCGRGVPKDSKMCCYCGCSTLVSSV